MNQAPSLLSCDSYRSALDDLKAALARASRLRSQCHVAGGGDGVPALGSHDRRVEEVWAVDEVGRLIIQTLNKVSSMPK